MIEIVDGRSERGLMDSIFARYREECGPDINVAFDYDSVLIAADCGEPLGMICYDKGDEYKVGILYAVDDAPEGTIQRLLSAVISYAQFQGASGVVIQALDPKDSYNSVCRGMGFSEMSACAQRTGVINLRKRF